MVLPKEVIVYTDGASRGNPGPASFGYVIKSADGTVLIDEGKFLGIQTNNYAEYMAVIEVLKACHKGGARNVTVRADSQLMVRQMLGEYKVKAEGIIPLFQECQKLVRQFESVKFQHVFREDNKDADAAANRALDER